MPKVPKLQRDQCTPEQQRVFDIIKRCRPGVGGPFQPLMYNPALAEHVAVLGEHLRFHGALPGADRELAVMTLARELRSGLEWIAHEGVAKTEGVREEAIAVAAEQRDTGSLEPREALVIEVARSLVHRHAVDDALYERGELLLGLPAWVELIALLGYYVMVSFLIGVFAVEPPPGKTLPAWARDATEA
jgi:4-carboxymuconolactone decarboxylase